MATITPLRPNGTLIPQRRIVLDTKATSQLQSPEGRKIDDILRNLIFIKQYLEYIEINSEINYNPVLPKRSERIIMRAKFKGRGKPMPYPLEEE
ncbi:MAG: hypothetical protein ACK5RT_00875 [Dolichospermum sp.]